MSILAYDVTYVEFPCLILCGYGSEDGAWLSHGHADGHGSWDGPSSGLTSVEHPGDDFM